MVKQFQSLSLPLPTTITNEKLPLVHLLLLQYDTKLRGLDVLHPLLLLLHQYQFPVIFVFSAIACNLWLEFLLKKTNKK